jgi:glucose-6-phosphate isomerase
MYEHKIFVEGALSGILTVRINGVELGKVEADRYS